MNKLVLNRLLLFICCLFVICTEGIGQQNNFLFSYFIGNGEDGLHFAHSKDGYHWKALNEGKSFLTPTAGKDKLMRDPSIAQGPDGTFHMVWTVSWGEKGIGYASSKDLINWSVQQYIPVMEHEQSARNCWAPELFYDTKSKTYFIYWATTIPGRFLLGEEQKYNHRLYYTTTKDFVNFSPAKLFYDHGFSVIDGVIVKSKKQYVMFLKDETDKPNVPEKNIRVATSKKPEGPYSKPGKPITGDYWAEGPTAINVDGKWFVYFDKYIEKKYGVITSDDLTNWTDKSAELEMPKGIRHGTAFAVSQSVIDKLMKVEK